MIKRKDILNPEPSFRPIPFWSWNDKLDPAELRQQVRQMHQAGIGGFFMHARGGLQTVYLSQEWIDCVNACCDEAGKLGMGAWLYDENGWPSGFGGGLVNGLGEEYQQKYLRFECKKAAECGTERTIAFYRPDGGYLGQSCPEDAEQMVIRCYYDVNIYYVDNLDRKVVEEFIRVTHQFYYENIPAEFLKHMRGIFTDEPQLSRNGIPWSFVLEEEYRKRCGKELLPRLAALFIETADAAEVRTGFWRCVTDVFNENFMKPIRQWCDKHNWKLTGHHVLEEYLQWQIVSNGAVMTQYEHYNIPGMDHLCRRLPDPIAMVQLASAAAQFGKKQILTESFALCGWNFGFQGMCWMYQQQMAHGINMLCQHLEGYSLRGLRKRDYPGSSFVHQPWWEDYKLINDYFSRAGMLLAEGSFVTETLVVHPMSSVWRIFAGDVTDSKLIAYTDVLQEISTALDSQQVMHHYLDESIFDRFGSLDNGRIRIGECTYSLVVIPPVNNLSAKIVQILRQFECGGGTVIKIKNSIEDRELTVDGVVPDAAVCDWFNNIKTVENASEATLFCSMQFPDMIRITENGKTAVDMLSTYRDITLDDGRNGRFYLVANKRYEESCKALVSVADSGASLELIDRESGEFFLLKNVERRDRRIYFEYPFGAGEMIMFFISDSPSEKVQERCIEDISEREVVCSLGNEFEIVHAGDGNIITLDKCAYKVNDEDWVYDDVCVIHHRLLRRKCDCDLEMRFSFFLDDDFDFSQQLTLVVETPELFSFSLNGKEFSALDSGKFFDQAFRRVILPCELRAGENIIGMKCHYHQDANIYNSLEKAKKFETEYNKLTYDSEIESIYLVGNFCVRCHGEVQTLDRGAKRYPSDFTLGRTLCGAVMNGADLVGEGMPFFAGKVSLRRSFTVDGQMLSRVRYLRFSPIGANSYRIRINGVEAGFCYIGQYAVDVTGLLREGENILEIEIVISLRNMLGPHHLEEGESFTVSTMMWNKEPNAMDKRNPPYNADYCFVSMGVDNIVLC